MPTTFTFDRKEHEEYGIAGWALRGSDFMEPLPGLAVAHDCLEHFKGDAGAVHEEFQAFGAMLHIRGDGGYWHSYSSGYITDPGEHMAADLGGTLFYYWLNEADEYVKPAPRTARLPDEWLEESIDTAIRSAHRTLRDECDTDYATRARFLNHFKAWVRIGYRKAKRRYAAAVCPEELAAMFHEIETAADAALKYEEAYALRVVVDIKGRSVRVRALYFGEDADDY